MLGLKEIRIEEINSSMMSSSPLELRGLARGKEIATAVASNKWRRKKITTRHSPELALLLARCVAREMAGLEKANNSPWATAADVRLAKYFPGENFDLSAHD